ncbi:LADA_0B10110g1_1 [Lachancea dasiensis]|uniref:DNA topoisomerase I n=1 Tax=Lachancea dasiensis TaxID=1072105 RepID=A0A1G4IVE0_9SACH|nr:LADA_0B10110g1_1 [Lachancea dasiensis]
MTVKLKGSSSSDEEDLPLSSTIPRTKRKIEDSDDEDIKSGSVITAANVKREEDKSYDSDLALSKVASPKKKVVKRGKRSSSKVAGRSLSSTKQKGIKKDSRAQPPKKISKRESSVEQQDADLDSISNEASQDADDFKWWEKENDDDSVKWISLKHNGVIFPPKYEPLPSHIKLYYNGRAVDLPPQAEEVAGFFAALLESDHAKNPVFQKNFFEDFLDVLQENGGPRNDIELKTFELCDFSKMFDYFQLQKEQKKQLSPQEKKRLKQEKEEFEEPYKFCMLDDRKEQVGNFRIEPPGLFRGRGAHPKTGKLKRRVYPEDVVLNLDKEAKVPEAPDNHNWGEVRHDNTVQWLAMWRENISNSFKYVRFAANSSLKGMSDYKKFEKARQLKDYIDPVRKDYMVNLKSKVMLERQIAVACYFIDVFALRAGGEKADDEADTVGCCSLRYEHVTLKPPNTVIFDFLGKDSIRFYQEVKVEKQVFKNLTLFKKPPKQPGHQLFDRLDPALLNKHLQNYMPGLTAKVFRTYNASKTMQDQLDLITDEGTVAEKILKYNAANRTVAILCNHQRTVTKGHAAAVQKATDRIEELEWQKIRLKRAILQLDKTEAKKNPNYFAEVKDLVKEQELLIHKRVIEKEREKFTKKFARENEKRKFDNEPPLPDSQLKEWMNKVDELESEYKREVETGKVEVKTSDVDKLKAQVEKLDQRIENYAIQLKDKEDNSQVALGTSKINYIDPRLSVVFCKKYGVPLEKVFTKSLRDKFKWAIESADENWRF